MRKSLALAQLVVATGVGLAVAIAPLTPPSASGAVVGVSYFPSSVSPAILADSDTASLELGMKFRVSQAGSVAAVKFFKGSSANAGTHKGSLWSSSGTRLASVTFANETATGWQTAVLAKPVPVKASTTYVVSYLAPVGRYSATNNYFTSSKTSGVFTAGSGAGVYKYGSTGGFPTSTWNNSNYFVDVVFEANPTTTTTITDADDATPTATRRRRRPDADRDGDPTPTPTPSPTVSPTATATPTPTATATVSPTPTATVVAGFPDASNTGYRNAPGYPGSLTTFTGTIQSNTTYRFMNFPGGLAVGSSSNHPVNVTFYGCRFATNSVLDANVAVYGDNITFDYSTFEPSAVSAPPVPYGKGYQYGIDLRYPGKLTIDHSDFWGFGEALQFGSSTSSKPVTVANSWMHDASAPGTDPATMYHTDGILSNDGGPSHMVFNHNTIVGDGNTNALALQTAGTAYDHVAVTNNYFSGYGYMVNTGGNTKSTNMTFTGNVWGTDYKPYWGPLYGAAAYTTPGLGGTWANNTIHVKTGTTWMAAGNHAKYWWPTDGNPSSATQIIGHTNDYTNP